MTDVTELQKSRNKIFKDFYTNTIPERMPVMATYYISVLAEYCGIDPIEYQFDFSKLMPIVDKVEEFGYSDTCPLKPAALGRRLPGAYQIMESQAFKMASSGQMQHPEVVGMYENEYKELIEDPYACILERVVPRQHKAFTLDDPIKRGIRISLLKSELDRQAAKSVEVIKKMTDKYGYYNGAPKGGNGAASAPFDYIADQLRGFTGICKDIRRNRQEVAEACERMLPLCFNMGMPANPNPEGQISMPLHMPTFLRRKDFEELWLPTYMRLIEQFAARGAKTRPLFEDDWTRYVDILQDFPAGTLMAFEHADWKLVKEKLGEKFILMGLFPLSLTKLAPKDEVIDKLKELLDIMLPGCGYVFDFDKSALLYSDINTENYRAVFDYLRDNAKFEHAGERYGHKLNEENYTLDESIGKFESKYLTNLEEYMDQNPYSPDFVKDNIRKDEIKDLKFWMSLLA